MKLGITYVAVQPSLGAVKVGYTNTRTDRRDQLVKRGWEPFRHLLSTTPRIAWEIEQAVLFDLRHRLYIPAFLTDRQMPERGWSETAALALISPDQLWHLVCEQAALLQMTPDVRRTRTWNTPPTYRRTKGDTPRYHPVARRLAVYEHRITPPRRAPKNAD